ncbi:predicted protein [Plenodomus lingam JN3]|uniref:Predicted protein n=1 Tax=Leptosphaeria maculans (strain JN3 / isolate v23.1.3 / race Av1-4-5-6-7-8) TaxID=985895 RepID=E4ZRA4_LEPMJ|nr:predicted protein [Plenodomus lingam JN3]CBX93769.1 predicted protein [Plenodomus lingam JN3]
MRPESSRKFLKPRQLRFSHSARQFTMPSSYNVTSSATAQSLEIRRELTKV